MDETEAKRARVLKEALRCRTALTMYARSLLGNYEAAEDAVQEAMLVVVNKFDQYAEGTSMLAWCRAIVRLEVLRARERSRREQSLPQRLLDDAIDATFDEFQTEQRNEDMQSWNKALLACLGRLSERSRLVLRSRVVDELSYDQIAVRTGMTIEGVRKALFRGRKQVRSCVETSLRGMS